MFGPSVLALALTPGVILGSPQVDTAAVGRGEVMVGSAPPFPREPPEAAVVLTATPGLAARLREPRYTLILQAAPRIYYRAPNFLNYYDRPLFLVGTRDSFQYRLSPRLDWTTRVDGTYGEVDYTSQQLAFGPIARQVDQAVTKVLALRGDTGLSWNVTRRYTIQFTAYGQHTEPIGKSVQNFPTTNGVRFRVQPRYQLDRVSSVDLDVSSSVYFVDPGGGYIGVAAAAGYERNLSPRTTLDLAAGATATKPREGPTAVAPVVNARISHVSYQRRGVQVTNRFGVILDAPLDPTTGRVYPTAAATVGASGQIAERWFVDAAGYAVTAVTKRPVSAETADTSIFADASVRHELVQGLHLSVGSRYLVRGTHLNAPEYHFFDREIWGFVALTFAVGLDSTQTPATWAL